MMQGSPGPYRTHRHQRSERQASRRRFDPGLGHQGQQPKWLVLLRALSVPGGPLHDRPRTASKQPSSRDSSARWLSALPQRTRPAGSTSQRFLQRKRMVWNTCWKVRSMLTSRIAKIPQVRIQAHRPAHRPPPSSTCTGTAWASRPRATGRACTSIPKRSGCMWTTSTPTSPSPLRMSGRTPSGRSPRVRTGCCVPPWGDCGDHAELR
mmetsp:Transcript_17636/g.45304  ORF Transcript_17636/g.45304 Transcript_17636/m.45304 type:complete len:208 (+) Transcript_17636:845-1468(+)